MNARELQDACRPMVSPCAPSKESTICDGLEPWTEGVSLLVHWKKVDVCSMWLHPMIRTWIRKTSCVLMLWRVDYCSLDFPDHDTQILHAQNKSWSFCWPFLSFQDAFSNPKSWAFCRDLLQLPSLPSGAIAFRRSLSEEVPFPTHSTEKLLKPAFLDIIPWSLSLKQPVKRSLVNLKTNYATLKVQLCHGARTVDRETCVLWQSNVHQACQLWDMSQKQVRNTFNICSKLWNWSAKFFGLNI